MSTTTKKDLIDAIAQRTGVRRHVVRDVVQEFLDRVNDEIGDGNRIELRDFGVLEVRERAARQAQNPKTLEPVVVPAKRTVKFKPGRRMRELLDRDAAVRDAGRGVSQPPAATAAGRLGMPGAVRSLRPGEGR